MSKTPTAPAVDPRKARDPQCPPWDCYDGPAKPVADYTAAEADEEAARLAWVYMERRRLSPDPEPWESPVSGRAYIVGEEEGCAVLVATEGRVRRGAGPGVDAVDAMADWPLGPGEAEARAIRADALAWLAGHPGHHGGVRADVVHVLILRERVARLRHLVGAFSWDEA